MGKPEWQICRLRAAGFFENSCKKKECLEAGGHSFMYIVNLWNSVCIVSKSRMCHKLTNAYSLSTWLLSYRVIRNREHFLLFGETILKRYGGVMDLEQNRVRSWATSRLGKIGFSSRILPKDPIRISWLCRWAVIKWEIAPMWSL